MSSSNSGVLQATAETVYDILSPAAPISRSLQDKRSSRKLRRGQQPADLREGMAKAYDAVREVRTTLDPLPGASIPTPHLLTSDLHRVSWIQLKPSVMWHQGAMSRRA